VVKAFNPTRAKHVSRNVGVLEHLHRLSKRDCDSEDSQEYDECICPDGNTGYCMDRVCQGCNEPTTPPEPESPSEPESPMEPYSPAETSGPEETSGSEMNGSEMNGSEPSGMDDESQQGSQG
jgi:hypothetical protein